MSKRKSKPDATHAEPQTAKKAATKKTATKKATATAAEKPAKTRKTPAKQQQFAPRPWTVEVIRPDDLLILKLEFQGFNLTQVNRQWVLTLQPPGVGVLPPTIVAHFQPQHIAEEAFFETAEGYTLPTDDPDKNTQPEVPRMPVKALIAGRSRIAFKVPDNTEPIPYNLTTLLEKMQGWQMRIVPTAAATPAPGLAPINPNDDGVLGQVTAIEFPYRLLLSPNETTRWRHAVTVERGERVPLWHTRLGAPPPSRLPAGGPFMLVPSLTLRAIWARDSGFQTASDSDFFRQSLNKSDRYNLVHLTSNSTLTPSPRPIRVKQFMLSALGAWADLHGSWKPGNGLSVEEWKHEATMGRDHYVRVVTAGYLFPFGHRASLVKITERKFHPQTEGNVAYLRQRMYIIVREPEKTFDGVADAKLNRQMPFKRVEITTRVTPNLDPPENTDVPNGSGQKAFWPQTGGRDFQFHLIAEDDNGQLADFTMPLFFIEKAENETASVVAKLLNHYKSSETPATRRTRPLSGQPINFGGALAGEQKNNRNDCLPATAITFNAEPLAQAQPNPQFYPVVEKAVTNIPALSTWLGANEKVEVGYYPGFVEHGLGGANSGQVVLQLTTPVRLDFNERGDKSGGIVKPNLSVRGISRLYGPVGDLASVAAGQFSPSQYFKPVKPANTPQAPHAPQQGDALDPALPIIFGALNLIDILPTDGAGSTLIPKITNSSEPEGSRMTVEWSVSELRDHAFFKKLAGGALNLKTEVFKPLGQSPITSVDCSLKKFQLELFQLIQLNFDRLQFKAEAGKTPDVNVDFSKIVFLGALGFLNTLSDFIKLDGFSDPPSLDISPQGISAGYSLALPPIAVGAFSLQNVTLGALFQLPFISEPMSLDFNFCRRDAKFLITVGPIGGGGFFEMRLTTGGVDSFEVGIEGGASIAINFGVASGRVGAMLGINFRHEKDVGVKLDAYLRIFGAVEVLGIMAVNIEMYMGLTYEQGVLRGDARLSVEIDLGLFSKSVTIKYSKTFAGSPAKAPLPPAQTLKRGKKIAAALPSHAPVLPVFSFKDFLSLTEWTTYNEAFV